MSRPIPARDYVEHFDPELPHHRAWSLAVLEQLVEYEFQTKEETMLLVASARFARHPLELHRVLLLSSPVP